MQPSAPAFGAVVRRRRRDRGLTQAALAEAADLHLNHISFLERGLRTPSLDVVFQVAHGLGVPVVELVAEVAEVLGSSDSAR